jgi:uncharacterized protein
MACLSSRVPYGETVTPAKLHMIEQAEYALRDLGFHDVRVRHHDLGSRLKVQGSGLKAGPDGQPQTLNAEPSNGQCLARIEVGPAEMQKFFANGVADKIAGALKKIGYTHVTLDLQGYRRGSVNEVLGKKAK